MIKILLLTYLLNSFNIYRNGKIKTYITYTMLKFILGMKELLPQEQETVLFLYGKAIKFLNPNLLKEYILEALTPG